MKTATKGKQAAAARNSNYQTIIGNN